MHPRRGAGGLLLAVLAEGSSAVTLLDATTGQLHQALPTGGPAEPPLRVCSFNPNGLTLAAAGAAAWAEASLPVLRARDGEAALPP